MSRHSSTTIADVQRLHAAGWSCYAIAKLYRRRGVALAETTIAEWVDPQLAERRRAEQAKRYRRRNARKSRGRLGAGPPRSPEFRMERMRSLRALGVAYSDIAKVMTFDFPAEPISENQARSALKDGVVPRPYRNAGLRKVAA